jgi:hypothetical protein
MKRNSSLICQSLTTNSERVPYINAARMEGEVCRGYEWGNLGERAHLKDLGVDGKVILKWFFEK